jgi:hypothetical protein
MKILGSAEEANEFVLDKARQIMDSLIKDCSELHPKQQRLITSRIVQVVHQAHFEMCFNAAEKHIEHVKEESKQCSDT